MMNTKAVSTNKIPNNQLFLVAVRARFSALLFADSEALLPLLAMAEVRATSMQSTKKARKEAMSISGSTAIRDRSKVYETTTGWSCSSTRLRARRITTGRPPFSSESRYVNLAIGGGAQRGGPVRNSHVQTVRQAVAVGAYLVAAVCSMA